MIAYEIQLRYVIRDKIQSKTNSVQDKIQSEKKFCWKKNFIGKKSQVCSQTEFCLRFPVHFFELSRTNRCLSSLSGMYIPQ